MVSRSIPSNDTSDGSTDNFRPDAMRGLSPEVIGEMRKENASLGNVGKKIVMERKQ